MPVTHFPDPRLADPDGLVAIGGDLHPESLKLAYQSGIFPWPLLDGSDVPLTWFCPDPRAILEFSSLHVPRSLERVRRTCPWRFSRNEAFEAVIRACSRVPRPGQRGTWITEAMADAYLEFHRLGHAHSVEVWEGETLVGGIYGVEVDGIFAGESMFHLRPNASKLALLHLISELRSNGVEWMDIQMMTPHLEALGACEISRDAFLEKLSRTRALGLRPFSV